MSDMINTPATENTKDADGQELDEYVVQIGEDVDLTARIPGLQNISLRAGWDAKSYNGNEIDLDISLICLNAKDQTIKDEDFIFYNNAEAFGGAIKHHGDSRHGAGDGDDEQVDIDLHGVPFDYLKIIVVISIYRGGEFDQNLGDVSNGFVRIVNEETDRQILRFKLNDVLKSREETACVAAVLERVGSQWVFKPVAEFDKGGLAAIASRHGLIIANQ